MIQVLRRIRERNMPDNEPFMADEQNETARSRDVESEIADVLRSTNLRAEPEPQQSVDYARQPLPDYVEHAEGIDQAARLSAQVVLARYEDLAKTVLEMKGSVQEQADTYQRALDDLGAEMQYIDETVQRIRDVGKKTFEELQKSARTMADVSANVRKTCDDIRGKIEPAA